MPEQGKGLKSGHKKFQNGILLQDFAKREGNLKVIFFLCSYSNFLQKSW